MVVIPGISNLVELIHQPVDGGELFYLRLTREFDEDDIENACTYVGFVTLPIGQIEYMAKADGSYYTANWFCASQPETEWERFAP